MESRPDKWEIELNLPKGKIKTFVYSHDGKNITDRFKPEYECKIIGRLEEEQTESEKLQDELEPIDEKDKSD